ncbi:MAG: hypothetical protein NW215_10735 [Hyphomicrobiales bacterium]|nr:hypothetical protein [Hyphomicrobiales bacterium]
MCGCKQRGQAIARGAAAIRRGDLSGAARNAGVVVETARRDMGALARAAGARLGLKNG